MIDPAPLIAAIEATPGEVISVTKAQFRELLTQLQLGNSARRTLTTVGSIARLQPGCAA